MLASESPVTELVDILVSRKTSHPILIGHLPEHREVQVSQTCVPPPCFFSAPCQHAHRLCNVAVEHIESVVRPWDLGK
jgi:hypothetical protein